MNEWYNNPQFLYVIASKAQQSLKEGNKRLFQHFVLRNDKAKK